MKINEMLALEGCHPDRNIGYLPQPNLVDVVISKVEAPHELIATAFCFAFDYEGRLLMANVRKRGVEIPGGHREIVNGTLELPVVTAIRETREETGGVIKYVAAVGFMRNVCMGEKPDGYKYPFPYSCQQFYVGVVQRVDPVSVPDECSDSIWVKPDQIHKHLSGRSLELYYAAYSWFIANEM